MALVSTLAAFALRQASIETGEKVVERVQGWFVDSSLGLQKAIKKANDRTWYALALALGGDGWMDRLRGFMFGADVRGVRDQIQAFLRHAGLGFESLPQRFRKNCLDELKSLQARGRLSLSEHDHDHVALRSKDFRRYDDPSALMSEARRAVDQLALELISEAPNLAELLQLQLAGDGRPLLVSAFSFFLRQELAGKQDLSNGIVLDTTERLYASQAEGFHALHAVVGDIDGDLHQFYELVVLEFDEMQQNILQTKVVVEDAGRNMQLLMEMLREQQNRISEQQERDRRERAELRHLVQLMLENVDPQRPNRHRPRPFVDPDQQDRADRAAVESLLARSQLNGQVREMMSDALDAELHDRRTVRRGARPAGTLRDGPLGMKMVWIPPGTFFMGSPTSEPRRDEDEFPHAVTLTKGVWMSAHAVTRRQWWEAMREMPGDLPRDDHPIEGVSWVQANEFLDVLTDRTLEVTRLPTEAEWEYACRAGTITPFAFGFRLSSDQANYHAASAGEGLGHAPAQSRAATTKAGSFPPNGWGLYDMHGNVMEWCHDWYAPYEIHDVYDPTGPKTGEAKVLRGGAWWSPVHACRSARRYAARPDITVLPVGFRVVMLEG